MSDLGTHLAPVLGVALARQTAFADVLGDRRWQLDLPSATVTFGDDLRHRIQLLGSQGDAAGTWLWAWANRAIDLPDDGLLAARWARGLGAERGLAELVEPEVPLDRADGHQLALLVAGLSGRPYYRGPYAGGAAFFLVEVDTDPLVLPVAPERVVTLVGQLLGLYGLPHRAVVGPFLAAAGWAVAQDGGDLVATHPGCSSVRVRFDELDRVASVDGSLRPA